jgi:hypothetical protein
LGFSVKKETFGWSQRQRIAVAVTYGRKMSAPVHGGGR